MAFSCRRRTAFTTRSASLQSRGYDFEERSKSWPSKKSSSNAVLYRMMPSFGVGGAARLWTVRGWQPDPRRKGLGARILLAFEGVQEVLETQVVVPLNGQLLVNRRMKLMNRVTTRIASGPLFQWHRSAFELVWHQLTALMEEDLSSLACICLNSLHRRYILGSSG